MLRETIILSILVIGGVASAEGPHVSEVSLNSSRTAPAHKPTSEEQAFRMNERAVEMVLHGQKDEGVALFVKASQLDPKNPTILYNLGGVYLSQGNIPKALEAINRCVALRPEDLSILHRLGEVHFAAENFADAAEVFERIAEKDSHFNEVLFHLGTVYAMQQRWDDAEKVLRRAVKISPDQSSLETNLANVLIMKKQYAEAAKILQHSQSREPQAETALALGVAYEGDNKMQEALAAYESAEKLGLKDDQLKIRLDAVRKKLSASSKKEQPGH